MRQPIVSENKPGACPFPLSVETFNTIIRTEVNAAARITQAAGLEVQ